jgi:hypothetical protein
MCIIIISKVMTLLIINYSHYYLIDFLHCYLLLIRDLSLKLGKHLQLYEVDTQNHSGNHNKFGRLKIEDQVKTRYYIRTRQLHVMSGNGRDQCGKNVFSNNFM